MENYKNTLYLSGLCIILIIWGSVIDGKRHLVEKQLSEKLQHAETQETTPVEKKQQEVQKSSKLSGKIKKLKNRLARANNELEEKSTELDNARNELKKSEEKASTATKELEELKLNMVRLSKVNTLLEQRLSQAEKMNRLKVGPPPNKDDKKDSTKEMINKTLKEIERLSQELEKARHEIKDLKENILKRDKETVGTKESSVSSNLSETQAALSKRTRICNRSRTQLSAALKDCSKALDMTRKKNDVLEQEKRSDADSTQIEMYKLNISILLTKIQEQQSIINKLQGINKDLTIQLNNKTGQAFGAVKSAG